MHWLSKTSTYTAALSAASFSPSASVASAMGAEEAHEATSGEDRIRAILRTAAHTVTAWTGAAVSACSNADEAKVGELVVSGRAILDRANAEGTAAATDYATGRLLIEASKGVSLNKVERTAMRGAVRNYTRERTATREVAAEYAAAHLAATVATVRGREAVLEEWPGWAGYFAAAEADRVTPEAAQAFIDSKAAPVVRAAFALGWWAQGRDGLDLPADIGALVERGAEVLAECGEWTRGKHLDGARAVVAAMMPPEPNGEDGEGEGEGSAEAAPGEDEHGEGEDGEGEGEGEGSAGDVPAVPMPQPGADKKHAVGEPTVRVTADPKEDRKPGAAPTGRDSGFTTTYTVREFPVRPAVDPTERSEAHDRMRTLARPMVAALSRIAWEATNPPQWDHAQTRGDVDEGAIDRLVAFGDHRVFQTRQETGRGLVSVEILVDCSGSMSNGTRAGYAVSRVEAAKAVAYALATSMRRPQFDVTVAGHDVPYTDPVTGRDMPRTVRYMPCPTPDSIAGLRAGCDNADGYAIAHAVKRVKARAGERKVVVLIADGDPAADGYYGRGSWEHVRTVVEAAHRDGVSFLAIGIEGQVDKIGATMFGRSRFVPISDTRSAGPLIARALTAIAKGGR